MSIGEIEPLAVFGLSEQATMADIDERYRVLAQLIHSDSLPTAHESVRQHAESRRRQLDAAYEALKAAHRPVPRQAPAQAPPRTVFNEPNVPLERLYRPQPSAETAQLWHRAGIQPILVRLDHATAVTLATPGIHGDDSRAAFLVSQGQWHLARSAEALLEIVHGLPEHDLREMPAWPWLASSLRPEHVIVQGAFMYDLPGMLENLAETVPRWRPALLTPVYDLCYELAIALQIDEVQEALAPGSALYRLYVLIKELGATPFPRPMTVANIQRFDMLDVFDAWSQICEVIGEYAVWHS